MSKLWSSVALAVKFKSSCPTRPPEKNGYLLMGHVMKVLYKRQRVLQCCHIMECNMTTQSLPARRLSNHLGSDRCLLLFRNVVEGKRQPPQTAGMSTVETFIFCLIFQECLTSFFREATPSYPPAILLACVLGEQDPTLNRKGFMMPYIRDILRMLSELPKLQHP